MNTLEKPSAEPAADQAAHTQGAEAVAQAQGAEQATEQATEQAPHGEPEITGFDAGTRSIFMEPSLYLSIAVMFVVSIVTLGRTPMMFWLSFIGSSVLAIVFHMVAERFLFKSKKEHQGIRAPFEGMFVVTLGAVLPGLGLLAYGIHSLSTTAKQGSLLEEAAKLGLLVIVPVFNLTVWSAVRKGYLTRPRLIGLMNGLAVGLSVSWTTIWIKSLLVPNGASCKFGWMLLLCASPFMLFAGACLSVDLWRKTESRIRVIVTTFSVIGAMLSFLFVFAPMVRCFSLQSLITDARDHKGAERTKAVNLLRAMATPAELKGATRQVSGFALAEMLLSNLGLQESSDADKDLYFQITGRSYGASTRDSGGKEPDYGSIVGANVSGLGLSKSQITGTLNAATLSSSLDWVMSFHNSGSNDAEARAEIKVPKGTAVSRVTLWINGQPHEGAFAPSAKSAAAYHSVVNARRDPLLVTMASPEHVVVQCYPVPGYGGDMKVRIGLKIPMNNGDRHACSMELPRILNANFTQPKRHRVGLVSSDPLSRDIPGLVVSMTGAQYAMNGVLKADQNNSLGVVSVERKTPFTRCATADWFSSHKQFIVQELREVRASTPQRLFVVVDASAGMKRDAEALKASLAALPTRLQPAVCIISEETSHSADSVIKKSDGGAETDADDDVESDADTDVGAGAEGARPAATSPALATNLKLMELDEAKGKITPDLFIGGQDNEAMLREVLEIAGEKSNSAVLWIHGAQPFHRESDDMPPLDLVHGVKMYDLQIEPGPISAPLQGLQKQDFSKLLTYISVDHQSSVIDDVKSLVDSWEHPATKVIIQRTAQTEQPAIPIIRDRQVSAELTCLWANDQAARLLAREDQRDAEELASRYRLVTPVTGAVVLDSAKEYKKFKLDPGQYVDGSARYANNAPTGLVGAPVDPRYGQSNEVGMLADYGYDTARDISRLVTAASFLVSLVVAGFFLKSRKSLSWPVLAKSGGLIGIVPVIIHLLGTFIINNYGGLGGGL